MIPPYVKLAGAPFRVLPPGIHWASLAEIDSRFGQSPHRAWLFEGVTKVAAVLQRANCARMYLDGSFVTEKILPNDFDGCWDAINVDVTRLDPVLLNFGDGRVAQKQKYRGEMFIANGQNSGVGTFLEFFQRERHTGLPKCLSGKKLNPMNHL